MTEDGEYLVLKGRKQWISNASVCDVMNVTCRMANPDGSTRLARVLVERSESSFEARELDMMGLRQAPLAEVLFDGCRVPRRNLCPDSGDTARLLTLTWLANRPLVGLMAVNLAQKALDAARSYAGMRKQFGRAIGAFQLIQQDLADIETAVISSRLVCYHALAAIDRGERANGLSAMAKRYSELVHAAQLAESGNSGRSYRAGDRELLMNIGVASCFSAIVILSLYVHSNEVTVLYRQPGLLLLLCPLLLYWTCRVWLKAQRGELNEDPVTLAITDPASYAVALTGLVIMLLSYLKFSL